MCKYCEPCYGPKPLVKTPRLMISLKAMNGLDWYVQVFWEKGPERYQIVSEPIDACPMCGKCLRGDAE